METVKEKTFLGGWSEPMKEKTNLEKLKEKDAIMTNEVCEAILKDKPKIYTEEEIRETDIEYRGGLMVGFNHGVLEFCDRIKKGLK